MAIVFPRPNPARHTCLVTSEAAGGTGDATPSSPRPRAAARRRCGDTTARAGSAARPRLVVTGKILEYHTKIFRLCSATAPSSSATSSAALCTASCGISTAAAGWRSWGAPGAGRGRPTAAWRQHPRWDGCNGCDDWSLMSVAMPTLRPGWGCGGAWCGAAAAWWAGWRRPRASCRAPTSCTSTLTSGDHWAEW